MKQLHTNEPLAHVHQVREKLSELVDHLHTDAKAVNDPKAAALFEMSAEVLAGLERAFERFSDQHGHAWRSMSVDDQRET